jgi:hypothetical protein
MNTLIPLFQITFGIVRLVKEELKPLRGRQLPVSVFPSADVNAVREEAEKKFFAFGYIDPGNYVVLYPNSYEEVDKIPGRQDAFTLKEYQREIGRPYSRVLLYLCSREDFDSWHRRVGKFCQYSLL